MASIHKDIPIEATAAEVWDAVRDFGAVHTRLAPGFVTDCRLDGDARIVTFANGNVAREILVDCDDARRRLAYAIKSERMTQHSASVQAWPTARRGPASSGSPTCCRMTSHLTSIARWIRARAPFRGRSAATESGAQECDASHGNARGRGARRRHTRKCLESFRPWA